MQGRMKLNDFERKRIMEMQFIGSVDLCSGISAVCVYGKPQKSDKMILLSGAIL